VAGGTGKLSAYKLGAIAVLFSFSIAVTVTVILPAVLFNPKPSERGNTYLPGLTENALRGRQIYVREGCVYCHSQFTRPQDRGMGPLVMAGDFVEELPNQLGTSRTGPDLTNEGGKHPPGWQKAHLINPRALKPGSIMPSFSYLSEQDMRDLVAYIEQLGARRTVTDLFAAPEEYRPVLARKTVDTDSDAVANVGHGIYVQDCATCHGISGMGNGPASISMESKPSNFTRPFFKQYNDLFWYYRISEGVPGTRMPRWRETLSEAQRWYLVAYLKRLPGQEEKVTRSVHDLDQFFMEMQHVHHEWNPPFLEGTKKTQAGGS